LEKCTKINQSKRLWESWQLLDELRLFQELLLSSEELNMRYHGKTLEIAAGLLLWIDDALEARTLQSG
jgi:hypothetical protein